MNWRDFVFKTVVDFCDETGSRTFTMGAFYEAVEPTVFAFAPANQHRRQKVRQQLQVLRSEGMLSFVDNHGTYTLRGVELLKNEVDKPEIVKSAAADENEKEYLKEVHARYHGWAKMARQTYGDWCLIDSCGNSFLKEDGTRYIEVHHIVPLSDGGEDAVWNLSVLCAHHHRMAHFASVIDRRSIQDSLLHKTEGIIASHLRQRNR